MRERLCTALSPMQRGFLPRLIGRAVSGTQVPGCGRISVILNHFRNSSNLVDKMAYSIVERGQPNTLEYRVFLKTHNSNIVSPFHDIPLYANRESKVFNMVVEIPRWTNAKMEICKEEKLNPIKQDVKKEKLRYVKNIFPHHGYIWNYGAFPQTWEDPGHLFDETATSGDNDPLDVCEIGHKVHECGAVIQVKVLGTMLLIDEGETDWKIICIDVTDPLAEQLSDISDVDKAMPGFLRATYEWFRFYKKPDGKPENTVHWDGKCKDKAFALRIVDEAHDLWKKLMADPVKGEGISCVNATVAGSPDKVSADAARSIMEQCKEPGQAQPVDQEVNKWYYVIQQDTPQAQA